MSVLQTVQKNCTGAFTVLQTVQKKQQTIYIWTDSAKKNNKQFTYGQTVQKKQQTIYIWTDSAKKTTNNLHMDRQCKKNNKQFTYGQTVQKNCTGAFTVLQTVQKKKKQFTYGQYIFTDCTENNVQNTYIYSVHIVYYKDILNYQRHIIHRMGTSTLCTVSIHNVVYT